MVSVEFAEASSEVNMILNYLPKSYIDKLPKKLIEFFKEVASKDYKPKFDPTGDLDNQELKEKTKDILAMLYMNYWCPEEQKANLRKQVSLNDEICENELKEKYDIDVFKDKQKMKEIEKEEKNEKKEEFALQVKRENWYIKVFENIKKWIKKYFKHDK